MANGHDANTPAMIPAPFPKLDARPRCSTCKFIKPTIVIGEAFCGWRPPPVVARLYAMLAAEPNTRVDYEGIFDTLPPTMKTGACSEYAPRQDA